MADCVLPKAALWGRVGSTNFVQVTFKKQESPERSWVSALQSQRESAASEGERDGRTPPRMFLMYKKDKVVEKNSKTFGHC